MKIVSSSIRFINWRNRKTNKILKKPSTIEKKIHEVEKNLLRARGKILMA